MRPLRRRPIPQDHREVANVVSHEDPLLVGGQGEHLLIVEPLQRQLLIERAYVMPVGLESSAHAWPGDVRVEQQPHDPGSADRALKERV